MEGFIHFCNMEKIVHDCLSLFALDLLFGLSIVGHNDVYCDFGPQLQQNLLAREASIS